MKFGAYLALVGTVSATQIRHENGTGMTDSSGPVARSSSDIHGQSLVQAGHGDSDEEKEEGPVVVPELKNETHQPELSFHKTYDHDMAQGSELRADAARMTVNIHKETVTQGPYCAEDDYVVAHWKKWNGTDGTKMEDVKESGDGRPAVFKLGHFQVSKCLDLAAQQMKSGGEVATITCPADLDQGGDVQKQYRNDYNGDYWLQNSTPTKYELTIQECSLHPHYLMDPPDEESLVVGFAFYILASNTDKDGNKMAITADPTDQYAPRTTGVHNVYLSKWAGKEHPNTKQQWMWNAEDNSIKSVGLPGGALFEGFNKNMIVYNWKGLHNQRFHYNMVSKKFQNRFTGNAMDVFGDKIIELENINTNEPDETIGQKWIIDYQSESHGHDHHH